MSGHSARRERGGCAGVRTLTRPAHRGQRRSCPRSHAPRCGHSRPSGHRDGLRDARVSSAGRSVSHVSNVRPGHGVAERRATRSAWPVGHHAVGRGASLSLCALGTAPSPASRRRRSAGSASPETWSMFTAARPICARILKSDLPRWHGEQRVCLGGAVRDDSRQPAVHRAASSISAPLVRLWLRWQRHDVRLPGGAAAAGALAGPAILAIMHCSSSAECGDRNRGARMTTSPKKGKTTGLPTRMANTPDIRIGTAGWSIPRASASRFGGSGTHLERYARSFRCAEINSSFYRPHAAATYAKWRDSTPPDFRFAVKMPRTITHELKLQDAREPLVAFLVQTDGLAQKRGPILVQLPPSLVV